MTRGPLAERLAALLTRARIARHRVRLTMSPALVSPIALASREIVLPEAAASLEGRQQEAMLAHELAHVVRNDPAWLVLAAVIEAALFVQPLNRLARVGVQTAAEELADDWAVRHLGTGLHLARCLTEVAEWQGRGRGTPSAFVSPMAGGERSLLVHRVQRLLADHGARGRGSGLRRGLLGVGLLAAVALGAPGLSLAHADEPEVIALGVTTDELPPPTLPPRTPPVFTLADADAPGIAVVDDAPTAGERRKLRRAERHERKAARARARAAALQADGRREVLFVGPGQLHIDDGAGSRVIVVRDEHEGRRVHVQRVDVSEPPRHVLAAAERAEMRAQADRAREHARQRAREAGRRHPDPAAIEALKREALRGHPDPAAIEALQRDAEALAHEAEALAREASHGSPEALARLQAQARRIAARAPGVDADELRRLERDIEAAVMRELPDAAAIAAEVRRSLPDAAAIEAEVRRSLPDAAAIEAEVRRSLPDAAVRAGERGELRELRGRVDRAREQAARAEKEWEKAAKEWKKVEKEWEKAERDVEKAREKAERDREKAREKAERDREKAREKAERERAKVEK